MVRVDAMDVSILITLITSNIFSLTLELQTREKKLELANFGPSYKRPLQRACTVKYKRDAKLADSVAAKYFFYLIVYFAIYREMRI